MIIALCILAWWAIGIVFTLVADWIMHRYFDEKYPGIGANKLTYGDLVSALFTGLAGPTAIVIIVIACLWYLLGSRNSRPPRERSWRSRPLFR